MQALAYPGDTRQVALRLRASPVSGDPLGSTPSPHLPCRVRIFTLRAGRACACGASAPAGGHRAWRLFPVGHSCPRCRRLPLPALREACWLRAESERWAQSGLRVVVCLGWPILQVKMTQRQILLWVPPEPMGVSSLLAENYPYLTRVVCVGGLPMCLTGNTQGRGGRPRDTS